MVAGLLLVLGIGRVEGSDLTLPRGGQVTIEFVRASSSARNTLSIVSPRAAIAASGCTVDAIRKLPGLPLVTGDPARERCRVTLDADPYQDGVQPFPAGST